MRGVAGYFNRETQIKPAIPRGVMPSVAYAAEMLAACRRILRGSIPVPYCRLCSHESTKWGAFPGDARCDVPHTRNTENAALPVV